jgi:membrane associated rhomboid family serine protease
VAFLRDTSSPQPFLRAPAAVVWLILVLLGTHALRVWVFPQDSDWLFINYGFVPALYSHAYLPAHGGNAASFAQLALPFVTYMFLHGSWMHVGINSVWLLAFGPAAARRYGSLLFLLFFLVCGAAGAAVHMALNWGEPNPLIGASAGISGLMAAAFRILSFEPGAPRSPLAPIFSTRIIMWTAIWVVVNTAAGKLGLGGGGELVGWQAHLGGYAAGLLLAGPFDMLVRPRIPLQEA